MTKSCIFKNLNSRRKADHNFCGKLLENHFKNLDYIQIPQAVWLESVVTGAPFGLFLPGPIFQILLHGSSITKKA